MNNLIIDISKDFSFSYGNMLLLKLNEENCPLHLIKGRIYAIFGKNGSGKTTFLNLINSLLNPSTGTISLTFKNINYVNKRFSKNEKILSRLISNNIRRCFQVPFLIDELSIYENINIAKRLYEKEKFINTFSPAGSNFKNHGINELINSFDLNGEELAEKLSYGQRRLVANLQVLYSNPELIILDEPFSNLNPIIIQKLKRLYLNNVKSYHSTIIIVEHTLENLNNFADEFFIIKNKQILKTKIN